MHRDFDIFIKDLSKIEGHTDLDVKVREGKVQEVKLRITGISGSILKRCAANPVSMYTSWFQESAVPAA